MFPATSDFQSSVMTRFHELENQHRRLKGVVFMLFLTFIIMHLAGVTFTWTVMARKSIETEEVVLRDRDGKMHARLALLEDGSRDYYAALEFFDAKGKVRIRQAIRSFPTLQFLNEDGGPLLTLQADRDLVRISMNAGNQCGNARLEAHTEGSDLVLAHTIFNKPRLEANCLTDSASVEIEGGQLGKAKLEVKKDLKGKALLTLSEEKVPKNPEERR